MTRLHSRLIQTIAIIIVVTTGCGIMLQGSKKPFLEETVLFTSGENGYHTFRIPAVITTTDGSLLAFCEGRKSTRSDTGNIDMMLRRSTDGGRSWSPMQVIWDDGDNVCGNPCPVVDRDTGTVWLLMTRNLGSDSEGEIMDGTSTDTRTVWVMKSDDDGISWSTPKDITSSAKRPDWTWYATGPGVGIQLASGRLVIPCDFAEKESREWGSHVIYSDDHGKFWHVGGIISPKCNECQVVEREDESLLINMRSYHGYNRRALSVSRDEGLSWSRLDWDQALVEPVCQASLLRYTTATEHDRNRILFSNPADTKRIRMTVRMSYDEGVSWPVSRVLHEGPSAYSCLTVLPDKSMGCLFEKGSGNAYETITFAHFNLEWLSARVDRLK